MIWRVRAPATPITVTKIQKKHPIFPKNSPYFLKNPYHLFNVFLWGLLKADLTVRTVIP